MKSDRSPLTQEVGHDVKKHLTELVRIRASILALEWEGFSLTLYMIGLIGGLMSGLVLFSDIPEGLKIAATVTQYGGLYVAWHLMKKRRPKTSYMIEFGDLTSEEGEIE